LNEEKYQEKTSVTHEIKIAIIKRLNDLNNDLDFVFI
jgi:hypothetical protein